MQAITLGHLDTLDHARSVVRKSFDVEEYHPKWNEGWDKAYEKFLMLV